MSDYRIRVLGGLPAIGRVHSYIPYSAATWEEPADGPEVEFDILDSRGRKADWLDRRITDAQRKHIEIELLERCSDDYRNRADIY